MDYFKENMFDSTEDIYQLTLDFMAECLEEIEPPVSPNSDSFHSGLFRSDSTSHSFAQLPPIRLPPFDGNFTEWEHFRDKFTALIIKNSNLSDFSRMHYLVSCVRGRALECIANLSVTAANFNVAWQTLSARYENKCRSLNMHLSTLLNLAVIPRESTSDLQSLRDKVNIAVASLKGLPRTAAELWNDMLVHIVVQRLDPITRKAWQLKVTDRDVPPSFEALDEFLAIRTRALEELSVGIANKPNKSAVIPRVNAVTASVSTNSQCPVCKARHYFSACPAFVRGNPRQRHDLAKRHGRCFNCLSQSHSVSDCTSKYACRICQQRHHTMLHAGAEVERASRTSISPPSTCQQAHGSEVTSPVTSLLASPIQGNKNQVLLATAWITVGVSTGRSVKARALIDQGSEMTFISENIAQLLRAKRYRMPTSVSAVGCVNAGTFRYAAQVIVSPLESGSPALTTAALILKSLTSYAPDRLTNLESLSHLADLPWADPNPMSADPIDIIIGADLYTDLIAEGLRKGARGEPIAQNSIFGWVISGPIGNVHSTLRPRSRAAVALNTAVHISAHHSLAAPSLDSEIRRFWEVEELPNRPLVSPEDAKCEQHFIDTHSRSTNGRYIVRLPFKTGPPIDIGESRRRAETLLNSLTRRLHADPEKFSAYSGFMTEYERLGHMTRVPSSAHSNKQRVYLPHHPVYRSDSSTSRLRVVFNASSYTSNNSSLNDHLLTGPKLQTELPTVILKWRQFKYVYTADVAKMYRQIGVDNRDIDYQRIVWKQSPLAASTEYHLRTVTYGMACAPFLALRVIQQLAIDEGKRFPLATTILRDNIYVDDLLFGDDNADRLRNKRDQLVALLKCGGFELRKWASNSAPLLSDIEVADHGVACDKSLSTDERLRILGIVWNPSLDSFEFRVSLTSETPTTKRAILSTIAKIYDPLGWVTPVVITAKIFMQRLWRLKIDWDESIPPSLLLQWNSIYSGMSKLSGIRIPRWMGCGNDVVHTELHGFSDASNVAYSAVVYMRVVLRSGTIAVSLLAGKSRVAPLSPLSVPRLELSGAVLLARLMEYVRRSLDASSLSCVCWTDSTIVLSWLSHHPSRWQTFVANRVHQVQTLIPQAKWQHVSTTDNPADCASRGLLGDDVLNHSLWWQGPSWLNRPEEEWPRTDFCLSEDTPLEKRTVAVNIATKGEGWELAYRYSSWQRLIRVTAYVYRFISACRGRQRFSQHSTDRSIILSAAEYNRAKLFWIKYIQAETFPSEIRSISHGHSLPASSPILKLDPFLDQDNVLRVGGRLASSRMPWAIKHPIILAHHPLVNLIIEKTHKLTLHAGTQLTLSTLRREFWVLKARSLVKAIIHQCIPCTRERAEKPHQLMGNLPSVRVSAPVRSFLHCGLDYAGPMHVRASAGRGIVSRKSYIALFICLASRAIHLELVSDYSTPAFSNAFSRFCARRGIPQSVYSDNGTTFVGADREMTKAYRAALRDPDFRSVTAADKVTWHFIPPSAPHFGGLWEAGVRSVKHHLRRVLGSHTLTFEELTTLLCRVEACLNSRPIAPLSDDVDNYDCLTPGHFLIGTAITVAPEPSVLDVSENRLTRWQLVRQMTEQFWKLWSHDYVNTLQQRGKWRKRQSSVKVGRLVLLRNSTLPPCKWELGRVTECHPGADSLTRVVTVKTATSEYKRPIVKLCLLPVEDDSSFEDVRESEVRGSPLV